MSSNVYAKLYDVLEVKVIFSFHFLYFTFGRVLCAGKTSSKGHY